MKIIFTILITFIFSYSLNELQDNSQYYFISGNLVEIDDNIEKSVRNYLKLNKSKTRYTQNSDFKLRSISTGKHNSTHLIFDYFYQDIPVFGKTIRTHIKKGFILSSISSNIEPISVSIQPTFSGKKALGKISTKHIFDRKSYLKYDDLIIF